MCYVSEQLVPFFSVALFCLAFLEHTQNLTEGW